MMKINNIELMVYDFDGVMTDNKVLLREDGLESVTVNRSDGLAVEILRKKGVRQIILSKEQNKVVKARAKKLQIEVLHGIDDKVSALVGFCKSEGVSLDNVVYIGNDLNDVEVMKLVGHPVCPSDAYPEVKEVSELVIDAAGGCGVIRSLLNFIEI